MRKQSYAQTPPQRIEKAQPRANCCRDSSSMQRERETRRRNLNENSKSYLSSNEPLLIGFGAKGVYFRPESLTLATQLAKEKSQLKNLDRSPAKRVFLRIRIQIMQHI